MEPQNQESPLRFKKKTRNASNCRENVPVINIVWYLYGDINQQSDTQLGGDFNVLFILSGKLI